MKTTKAILVTLIAILLAWQPVQAQSGDIIQVASASSIQTTFLTVLKSADLLGTLKGNGPFTVFVPTNDAFSKLPGGTIENWTKPENNPALTKIIINHVVLGIFDAATISKLIFDGGGKAFLPTISGGKLLASSEGGRIKLTDETGHSAYITAADMKASNGLIHVIDEVLLPK